MQIDTTQTQTHPARRELCANKNTNLCDAATVFTNWGVGEHLIHATLDPDRYIHITGNKIMISSFSSTSTPNPRSLDNDGVSRHVEAQMLKHRHATLSVLCRAAVG